MARGKWEPTRGPVLKDGSGYRDKAGDPRRKEEKTQRYENSRNDGRVRKETS